MTETNKADALFQIAEVLGPETTTRLLQMTHTVAVVAGNELDLTGLDAKALAGLPAVRDAILTEQELNLDVAIQQIRELPGVEARLSGAGEKARVQRAHESRMEGMSPGERMTHARKHNLTSPAPKTPRSELSDEERARLDGIKSPAARMALARKYGSE